MDALELYWPKSLGFGHPLRAGLYARVTTHDQQTQPLQIKEVGSGASQRELRATLIAAPRRGEIDVVRVFVNGGAGSGHDGRTTGDICRDRTRDLN